jgi:hypothetical protein
VCGGDFVYPTLIDEREEESVAKLPSCGFQIGLMFARYLGDGGLTANELNTQALGSFPHELLIGNRIWPSQLMVEMDYGKV